MSNILTDILGLDARGQYKGDPLNAKDVFVIGDVHQPRMLGISSPIPIRDEKLVTFYDLALSVIGLLRIENTTGSPPPSVTPGAQLVIGPDQTGNPFLWKVRTLTSTDNTVAFSYTGADDEQVDLSMVLSTDVHVISFSYDQINHILNIRLNSGTSFDVDVSNLALEVLDDSVPVETNVTNMSFDGPGVLATQSGPAGSVSIEIPQGTIEIEDEGVAIPITPSLEAINFTGAGVTASSAGAGTGTINVDVSGSSPVIIEDEGTPVNTAPLTVIDFVGNGVQATQPSAGEVQVTIADQEEVFLLMSSSCYFTPVRVGESYTVTPPVNPIYRFGGANPGFASGDIFIADTHDWNDPAAEVTVTATGPTDPQNFVAKEDQITQAIPIPIDLTATDKIKISGTCYVNQDLADGQAKIKVALGQGECADDRVFNILNAPSIDTFSGVAEDATNARRGAYQRMCFEFDTVIGGDGAQAGEDHFFIGFSFEGLDLPTSGDYTEVISVNWNMSAIKNPS
jgi:hypothetical protein